MNQVSAYTAKTYLSSILERVRHGEVITITKHGNPVAVLSPPDKNKRRSISETISSLKEFRGKHSLGGISIKELISEGRD